MIFNPNLFQITLLTALQEQDIVLAQAELDLMEKFALKIIEVNQGLNLTRITQTEEMAIKNFFDSLTLLLIDFPPQLKVLDVGTGAGFPGVPLAIVRPNWKCTLLDSLSKRLKFLDQATKELGISNVSTLHARAEDVGQDLEQREVYDLVVSRAVASLPTLLELCTPMVKVGGHFVSYKGANAEEELDQAQVALACLKLKTKHVFSINLPGDLGARKLILFEKIAPTPSNYPRRAGIPSKRPLV